MDTALCLGRLDIKSRATTAVILKNVEIIAVHKGIWPLLRRSVGVRFVVQVCHTGFPAKIGWTKKKNFFFEKKKQKTFAHGVWRLVQRRSPGASRNG